MPTADLLPQPQLNSYNVNQLQFALKNDDGIYIHDDIISADTDHLDYDSRRMSSSATSTADTDSSMLSRGEKRSLTPADDPLPKKQRPDWDTDDAQAPSPHDKAHNDAGIDKVQLPSIFTTFEDSYRHDGRRASLPILSDSRVRHAPYPPTHLRQNYTPSNQSGLSNYTFPNVDDQDRPSSRPRVDMNFNGGGGAYESYPNSGLSNGTTPSTSFSSFNSPLNSDLRTPGLSPYSEHDYASPSGIVRPSSTPGGLSSPAVKYDDGLRHASFSAPMSQAQHMFAGSARISGQHDRRSLSAIKSEWSFPNNNDFVLPSGNHHHYSPNLGPATPSIAVQSPSRSPNSMSASTLVDRPTRKRGKLPKETTDYLKAWLHRHSDHPYPSEEEKKQLCHATSLSMSQVSNWMINARRRILAPAHRAASGPTTTAPFPPSSRSASLSGLLDPIGRRASMPAADALQLYHPMSLQSMPNSPAHHHHPHHAPHHHDYVGGPARHHMPLGLSSSREYGGRHLGGGSGLYAPGQGGSGGGGGGGSYMGGGDVPLSAPPTLSGNPFSSSSSGHSSGGGGGGGYALPSPRATGQTPYFSEAHSGSGSGSGYGTPQ